MFEALILFADDQQKQAQPEPSLWQNPIFLLPVLFFLFYFVVLLPQQRKQKREQEALFTGLKKNDKVVTAAGIIGVIAHIEDGNEEVTLKIDDNARMKILKSTIVRIMNPKEETRNQAAPTVASNNTNIKPTA